MPPDPETPILSLRRLKKSYGDFLAVDDLSLDIYRGEVFGLLGPNGAGKTTTILMTCGLLTYDEGEILVDGSRLADDYPACKYRMGLCPEDIVIWESLTCAEQLVFMGQQYNLTRESARVKTDDVLDRLGLTEHRHKLAKNLSGGMKRRLNIALALLHDPGILILDEPQAGLDPQSRVLVREYIRTLSKNKTVILTTHDMEEVDRLADRVGIIDHGRLLVLDTPEGLKNRIGAGDILEIKFDGSQAGNIETLKQAIPASFGEASLHDDTLRLVNVDPQRLLPLILEVFKTAQVEIQDLTIRKKTLEDVFIDLTGRSLRR
jgi:ABC-2 type transport system ATP-binding protein